MLLLLLRWLLPVAAQALVVQPAKEGIDLLRIAPVDAGRGCKCGLVGLWVLLRVPVLRLRLLLLRWRRLLLLLLLRGLLLPLLLLRGLLLPLLLLLLLLERVGCRVGGPQRHRKVWVLAGQRHSRQLAGR